MRRHVHVSTAIVSTATVSTAIVSMARYLAPLRRAAVEVPPDVAAERGEWAPGLLAPLVRVEGSHDVGGLALRAPV